MKRLFLVLPLPFLLLLLACGKEPEPAPDPVALERLVASMEAEPVAAGVPEPGTKESDKEHDVAKVAQSLEKLDVERVDPTVAEALIGS